ncbi:MAG: glycosyltransferase family 39 protein [Chloracidobacterium sp.]|nr:glycosyltransferase family 39 protein [Chloracidobacterium sp.]
MKFLRDHRLLLFSLTVFIYFGSAFQPALLDDADAANAETAREMIERDDWVTLHMNGVRFLEKAPLMYWAIAGSFRLFGVSTFTARLPLALAALALVMTVYGFGEWMSGERAGFYAGLSLCVGFGAYLFTRVLIFEVILTLWITLAFFIFLKVYYEELNTNWIYGFYACLAAAVLSKALIGALFPLVTLFLFVLLTDGWRRVRQMRPLSGALLFLLLAVPWHALAGMRNEKFFWFYFINEHVKRFLGTRYPMDYDTTPLLQFWLGHLIWLFPFSAFLPLVLIRLRRLKRPTDRQDQLRLLAILWFLVIVVFFSFSTRQEYYTFPVFPALALLLGDALAAGEREKSRLVVWGQGFLLAVGLLSSAALGYMLWLSRHASPASDIAQLLTSNPENYRLSLGHASDLTTAAFASLRFPAAGAALALCLGFAMAFGFRLWRRDYAASWATALTAAVFIYFAHFAFGVFNPVLSTYPLAKAIQLRLKPEDLVAFNGEYQNHSSVGFYLKRRVLLIDGRTTVLEFGSRYSDCPPVFIDKAEIARLWTQGQRVFLFTTDENFATLEKALSGVVYPIARAGGKSVYSNYP